LAWKPCIFTIVDTVSPKTVLAEMGRF
jgi:hypothetical protein